MCMMSALKRCICSAETNEPRVRISNLPRPADEIFHASKATLMRVHVFGKVHEMHGRLAEVPHTGTLWAWSSASRCPSSTALLYDASPRQDISVSLGLR